MKKNIWRRTKIPVLILFLVGGALLFPGYSKDKQFKVNTYSKGDQKNSSTASDEKGNFIVAWVSDKQDGELSGIFARRFHKNGTPRGKEFQVNTFWEQLQEWPAVAMGSEGSFVIVWESYIIEGQWNGGISGRLFDERGEPLGLEFQVNTFTDSYQGGPAVAMDKYGNFIVVWESVDQDGNGMGIFAQRFNSEAMPLDPEFQVNTYFKNDQIHPALAADKKGNFVVVWTSYEQDGDKTGIFAQRFKGDGTPQGQEFQVNTTTLSWQEWPDMAMDEKGQFVICWHSNEGAGQFYDIFARKFKKNGEALGPEFKVNTLTAGWQIFPAIDVDSEGNFIVVWQSQKKERGSFEIYARKYNHEGQALGPEFRVKKRKKGTQELPDVTLLDLEDFKVTWKGLRAKNFKWDIFARIFRTK